MIKKDTRKLVEKEWKNAVECSFTVVETREKEMDQLEELWKKINNITEDQLYTIRQISWLSRCNWNLKTSLDSLIVAIGDGTKSDIRIGHNYSITEERWRKAWAYYLSLKKWLPSGGRYTGFDTMLRFCDPKGEIQNRINTMLGDTNRLKQQYVELFTYFLEFHIQGRHPDDSVQMFAKNSAIKSLNREIMKNKYDKMILAAVQIRPEEISDGKLKWYEICHHKFFRRCDITISSIGANEWRSVIPEKKRDVDELNILLSKYLTATELWLKGNSDEEMFNNNIIRLLGKKNSIKNFQVHFLNSFLKGNINE